MPTKRISVHKICYTLIAIHVYSTSHVQFIARVNRCGDINKSVKLLLCFVRLNKQFSTLVFVMCILIIIGIIDNDRKKEEN